jgi:hypothetical protein
MMANGLMFVHCDLNLTQVKIIHLPKFHLKKIHIAYFTMAKLKIFGMSPLKVIESGHPGVTDVFNGTRKQKHSGDCVGLKN